MEKELVNGDELLTLFRSVVELPERLIRLSVTMELDAAVVVNATFYAQSKGEEEND
jgi:hypothetical protein